MDKTSESYAQRILAELKVIANSIVGFGHAKSDDHSRPHQDNSNPSSDQAQAGALKKVIAAKGEPSKGQEGKAHKGDAKSHPALRRHKPVIELVALVLVLLYTGAAIYQAFLTKESFTSVSRAFVYLDALGVSQTTVNGEVTSVNINGKIRN